MIGRCIGETSLIEVSFISKEMSLVSFAMFCLTPFCAYWLTKRYRSETCHANKRVELFTLTQGFMHTFLMLFYASLWLAMFFYVYMTWFDNGQIFDAYIAQIKDPAFVEAFKQSGMEKDLNAALGGKSLEDVVKQMRTIPASFYALMTINTSLVWTPLFSLLVALVTRRQ